MPPRNPHRTLESEDNLARRVAYERERLEMTYEGLAKRMTDAGCAINASGIYKIEKGEPRRRITVDELIGFSRVFATPPEQLLLPVEVVADKAMERALDRLRTATMDVDHAQRKLDQVREQVNGELAKLGMTLGGDVQSGVATDGQAWMIMDAPKKSDGGGERVKRRKKT